MCSQCNRKLKCGGGSTTGLRNHLKLVHHIEFSANKKTDDQPQLNFIKISKEEEYRADISRMAALDNFSFHQISKSKFIQESL